MPSRARRPADARPSAESRTVSRRAATPSPSRRKADRPGVRRLPGAQACREKFLATFPDGFQDDTYIAWERGYKWQAHEAWQQALGRNDLDRLIALRRHGEVAAHAVRIESRTNLLFSFEKMALRDAVRSPKGARAFAEGLQAFLHGRGPAEGRFLAWRDAVAGLPRRKTRVLTWPLLTVFGFIAQPERHMFLKPMVTRRAAREYGYDFQYSSRPDWATYASLLGFAEACAATTPTWLRRT